jgi:hypothetical protein
MRPPENFSASTHSKASLLIGISHQVSHCRCHSELNLRPPSPGLLNSTFEILYDNDVLSLEAFEMWKNDNENQQGKGEKSRDCLSELALN